MDGSKTKAMESAASYTGSTNPGDTFKYVIALASCCSTRPWVLLHDAEKAGIPCSVTHLRL